MNEYIIIEDNTEVYKQKFDEEEVAGLLESGFVSAILRLNNGKLEYAYDDLENNIIVWKEPILRV